MLHRLKALPDSWALGKSSGETTIDVLWRLLNGELPFGVKVEQILLEIGGNDLLWMLDEVELQHNALTQLFSDSHRNLHILDLDYV